MRDRTSRRIAGGNRRLHLTALLLVAVALLLSACAGEQSALAPRGPYAQAPHDLVIPVFLIALVVFVFVQGLIIVAVVRFRQRGDDGDDQLPEQVHGNTRLEIVWTVIPALILAVIAVPTVQGIFDQMAEPDDGFLTIEVIGHRWWFEFYYPDWDIYTANELAIPAGTPVRLAMTAADPARDPSEGVIHSFWVPGLAGKQDLVPGQTTHLNLQADEPGRFIGQCAEYCGLSHVNMRIRVDALSPAEFDAWVERQSTPAPEPEPGTLEAQGAELFGALGDGRQSCVACHQIWHGDGARAPSVGPDLTHLMDREEFAGAIHDLNEDNLREWLRNPPAMKAMQPERGIGMPDLNLTEEEIDALVAYLLTLE